MPYIDYKSKPKTKIWDGIYGQIHHSNTITCAHITIEAGVALPEHHHIHEQWSHLLEGEMEWEFGWRVAHHEGWRGLPICPAMFRIAPKH